MLLRFTCRLLTMLALLSVVLPLCAYAPRSPVPRRTSHSIAPGVGLIQEVVSDKSARGPLTITALRIEKRQRRRIHAALGQDRVWGTDPTLGRESVSRYIARHQPEVLAAVNAGFFGNSGNPIGLHIQAGEMVTEASSNRSVFCLMKNGDATIARFRFTGFARQGRTSFPVAGLNRRQGKGNELLVFTPRFGSATPRSPGRVEIVLPRVTKPLGARGTVTGVPRRLTVGGGTPISPQTIVLSGGGTGAAFLRRAVAAKRKMTLHLETRATNDDRLRPEQIREAVAGGPRLLTNGRITVTWAEEKLEARFAAQPHPRTAVGIAADGAVLFFTIDGRQAGVSRGVTLAELAQILRAWKIRDAVNLDGGGSSALVVRGLLVNCPSDGYERPVANLLTVEISGASPSGESGKRQPLLIPPRPLQVGETWTLVSSVYKKERGVWGLPGGQPIVGFVSQRGVFRAVRPGTASISWVSDKGRSQTVSLSVVPAAKKQLGALRRRSTSPR